MSEAQGCIAKIRDWRHAQLLYAGAAHLPSLSFMDTPAWMQVVEPRLEQAAEVVEPCLEQAAEEVRQAWIPACAGMTAVVRMTT